LKNFKAVLKIHTDILNAVDENYTETANALHDYIADFRRALLAFTLSLLPDFFRPFSTIFLVSLNALSSIFLI